MPLFFCFLMEYQALLLLTLQLSDPNPPASQVVPGNNDGQKTQYLLAALQLADYLLANKGDFDQGLLDLDLQQFIIQ